MEKLEHNFPAILNEVIKCDIFLAGEKQSWKVLHTVNAHK